MPWQPRGGWRPRDGEAPYFSGFAGQIAFADLDPDFKVAGQFVSRLGMLTIEKQIICHSYGCVLHIL